MIRVTTEALEALLSGHHPTTGAQLGCALVDRVDKHGHTIKAVAGFDATLSAPKSLSVLWGLTGDDGFAECHDVAVNAVVAMVEKYGSTTRIRSNGARLHPETQGLSVGVFRQSTNVDLATLVQPIIDASLEPGALDWNCCGVDVPPTSVRLGVRVAGYDDILLSSGTRLDGTPALAADPITGDNFGHGLVRQATLALIADGTIDPVATIDQWFPDQPNADRVTVQMLLDNTHGWTTTTDFITENLLADLARTWTLAETLALASAQPPVAEPGTFDSTGRGNTVGMIALAGVLEQVTGSALADIVRDQVTEPLGLSDTFVRDGTDDPSDLQGGRFVLPGGTEAVDARGLSPVAFRTIDPPSNAVITTVPDLLEFLDAWSTGDYPGGVRATSANFPTLDGQVDAYLGHGIPFNGYCPCEPAADGNTPAVTGRQPNGIGNAMMVYNYPDGISVVLQYNSQEYSSKVGIRQIADEIHDTVAAAVTT